MLLCHFTWYAMQTNNIAAVVLRGTIRYIFSEEKISFQGDGIEGSYEWNKIIK